MKKTVTPDNLEKQVLYIKNKQFQKGVALLSTTYVPYLIIGLLNGYLTLNALVILDILCVIGGYVTYFLTKPLLEKEWLRNVIVVHVIIMYLLTTMTCQEVYGIFVAIPIVIMLSVYEDAQFILINYSIMLSYSMYHVWKVLGQHGITKTNVVDMYVIGMIMFSILILNKKIKTITIQANDMKYELLEAQSQSITEMNERIIKTTKDVNENLFNMVNQIDQNKTRSNSTADAISDLEASVANLAHNLEQQGCSSNEIQTRLENILNLISSLEIKTKLSNEKSYACDNNTSTIREASERMANLSQNVESNAVILKSDVDKVKTMTDIIKGISEQTSLLSLNAMIEAARAGESGKGFAVVASEIKALSDNTDNAVQEIKTILQNLCDSSSAVFEGVADMKSEIDKQNLSIDKVSHDSHDLNDTVANIENLVQKVLNQAKDIVISNNKIVESNVSISAVSQELVATIETINQDTKSIYESSCDINDLATEIKEKVDNMLV